MMCDYEILGTPSDREGNPRGQGFMDVDNVGISNGAHGLGALSGTHGQLRHGTVESDIDRGAHEMQVNTVMDGRRPGSRCHHCHVVAVGHQPRGQSQNVGGNTAWGVQRVGTEQSHVHVMFRHPGRTAGA